MSSSDVSSFIEQAAVVGRRLLAGGSFAMLRTSSGSEAAATGKRHEVRDFLARESRRLQSHALSLLAEKLEVDPFVKVKGMISDMMEKLMKEANADAEQEGFCDTEMGKSKATRTQLSEEIDGLTASIEDAKAEVMSLAESNSQLSNSINDLNEALGKATEMRTAEKKKNADTVTDAEAAVKAVDAATAVLKDFYKKASEATALVQDGDASAARQQQGGIKMGSDQWEALANTNADNVDPGHKAGMQNFGDAYKGNQDGATGVLAMIEVIRSDFANLAADTKSGEEAALTSFDEFTVESKRNIKVKSKKMELNEADKVATERKLQEDSKDLKSNQEELTAADRYYSKLVPQCVDQGSSYEERTKARASEIQSLKEALTMLE